MKVLKIALTGGPCGGKTTSLTTIEEKFTEKGYEVIIVQEAATQLINSGHKPANNSAKEIYEFQRKIMQKQFELEEEAERKAEQTNKPAIIICDRGLLDNKAYMSKTAYKKLVREFKTTQFDLLNRYDLVMHLKTAADGKEEIYETEKGNNKARSETAEEAREKDAKTLEAWLGHDNLKIFGNDTDFETKIEGTLIEIHKMLKTSYPIQKQEKYLVTAFDMEALIKKHPVTIRIEQYAMLTEFGEVMYRKSIKGSETKYTKITKTDTQDEGERIVTRKIITKKEYFKNFKENIPPLKKTRYCFEYSNQYFRLDIFEDGLILLEIEETNKTRRRAIPKFITIVEDVTTSPEYRNAVIYINKTTPPKVNKKKIYLFEHI